MFPFIFFLFSAGSYGQRIEQFYDWQWKRSEPEYARFFVLIEKKDSLWERKNYYIREKSLEMKGFYTDTSCRVANGMFQYFHPNGWLKATGNFINGKRQGTWLSFYPNGLMEDSAVFDNGKTTGTKLSWHANGYIADSSVRTADGNGVSVGWFDNGSPSFAGRFIRGKKNGKWTYFHRNGKPSDTEVYENGVLISRQYFDESGNALTDTAGHDRAATFNGGMEAWKKFIEKQLYFPSQYKLVNADHAVVVVSGVIDEDGNMTEVQVDTPFHPDFDKIAANAVRKSPKWSPAIANNRRVKYKIRQVVGFQQGSN